MTRKQSKILMALVQLLLQELSLFTRFIALVETTQCWDFLRAHHILHENKDIQCIQDLNEQKDISISVLKLMLPKN